MLFPSRPFSKRAWFSSWWDQTEQLFNEIVLRRAILLPFLINIFVWLLHSAIACVQKISLCQASYTLLSTGPEQRFARHLDRLDYKCSKNLRNRPSACKNDRKHEPISCGQERELGKWFALPYPCPCTLRWLKLFKSSCWFSWVDPWLLRGQKFSATEKEKKNFS